MNHLQQEIPGQPTFLPLPGQAPLNVTSAKKSGSDTEMLETTMFSLSYLPKELFIQAALENAQSWQLKLREVGKPELNVIADHLGSFIKYLTTADPDTKAIGRSMIQMGDLTMTAARSAQAGIANTINDLGIWLKKTGEAM
ncbi:MAG: hypothetical protein V4714_10340 [Bacteroidota bacterium]